MPAVACGEPRHMELPQAKRGAVRSGSRGLARSGASNGPSRDRRAACQGERAPAPLPRWNCEDDQGSVGPPSTPHEGSAKPVVQRLHTCVLLLRSCHLHNPHALPLSYRTLREASRCCILTAGFTHEARNREEISLVILDFYSRTIVGGFDAC